MKKGISIFLTALLLLGNFNLSYGKHFCGQIEVASEWMFGHQHLDCGMGMMEEHHASDEKSFHAPGCCENKYTPQAEYSAAISQENDNEIPAINFAQILPHEVYITQVRQ